MHRRFVSPAEHDLLLSQGHTVDVDTALVNTSEVKDYHMILLLGIGESLVLS